MTKAEKDALAEDAAKVLEVQRLTAEPLIVRAQNRMGGVWQSKLLPVCSAYEHNKLCLFFLYLAACSQHACCLAFAWLATSPVYCIHAWMFAV